MPGHPTPPASVVQAQKYTERFKMLFDTHATMFLHMDSCENWWLINSIGGSQGYSVSDAEYLAWIARTNSDA